MLNLRSTMRWLPVVLPISLAVVLAPAALAANPTIASLTPSSAIAGGPEFTLTIKGTDFVSGAKAKWVTGKATTSLKTTVLSSKLLTATVPASLIATRGTANVTVTTAGGTSNKKTFTIDPPKPIIIGLIPGSALEGGHAFTLTIDGANFAKGALAKWIGKAGVTPLATTFVNKTRLTAKVPAKQIATGWTLHESRELIAAQ